MAVSPTPRLNWVRSGPRAEAPGGVAGPAIARARSASMVAARPQIGLRCARRMFFRRSADDAPTPENATHGEPHMVRAACRQTSRWTKQDVPHPDSHRRTASRARRVMAGPHRGTHRRQGPRRGLRSCSTPSTATTGRSRRCRPVPRAAAARPAALCARRQVPQANRSPLEWLEPAPAYTLPRMLSNLCVRS